MYDLIFIYMYSSLSPKKRVVKVAVMFKKPNTACYLGAQTILVAILEGSWQHWVSHWDTGEMGRGTKTIVIQIIIIIITIIINGNTEWVNHAALCHACAASSQWSSENCQHKWLHNWMHEHILLATVEAATWRRSSEVRKSENFSSVELYPWSTMKIEVSTIHRSKCHHGWVLPSPYSEPTNTPTIKATGIYHSLMKVVLSIYAIIWGKKCLLHVIEIS